MMNKAPSRIKKRGPGRPAKQEPDRAPLLLKAARRSFAYFGFEAATLRGIAAKAGVDHTLVSHRFGSKEALWEAVVDQQVAYIAPFIKRLRELQTQTDVPIRNRLETAFGYLISTAFGEPDCGLILSRISSERGKQLDILVKKLFRPVYDALYPLLREAAKARIIEKQNLTLLYFMILNAIVMSVSYRHLLGYLGGDFENTEKLKKDMHHSLMLNFLTLSPAPAGRSSLVKSKKR